MNELYTQKFAHIHIPKCAGVDVLNFFGCGLPFDKSTKISDAKKFKKYGKVYCRVPHHYTIKMVKDQLPEDCITFAFIRNPWDRVVSNYLHQIKWAIIKESVTFEEFVRNIRRGDVRDTASQLYWLVDSEYSSEKYYSKLRSYNHLEKFPEKLIVNKVMKLENVREEWKNLCSLIKIDYLPLQKTHINEGRKHYTFYHNKTTIKLILEYYMEEIVRFNYSYEG